MGGGESLGTRLLLGLTPGFQKSSANTTVEDAVSVRPFETVITTANKMHNEKHAAHYIVLHKIHSKCETECV